MAYTEIKITIEAPAGSRKEFIFLAVLKEIEKKSNILECNTIVKGNTETHILKVSEK